MAINQLIARGVAPIGQDLPQIGNMLFQRDQARQQNALAQMAAQADVTRANAFDAQVRGSQASAEEERARQFLQQDFDTVAANPQLMPQFVQLLRSTAAPDLPENVTLPEIALRFRLKSPTPVDPGPLETIDKAGVPTLVPRREAVGQPAYQRPAPVTNVTVGSPAVESEASKAVGRAVGDAFAEVINQGRAAGEELETLRALRSSPAVTGPGADSIASVTQLFSSLGIPVSETALTNAANVKQFGAAVGGVVLQRQMAQKGPQTESDTKRIKETLAKTSDVKVVRDAVLDYNIAIAERKEMRAEFFDQYRQRTGKIDGAESEWNKFKRETPLVMTNPKNNRLVFFHNFRDAAKQLNPAATDDEILAEWRGVSRGRN